MKMVAEGVRTTGAALALGARHGIELPIAAQMAAVLDGRAARRREAVEALMLPPAAARSGRSAVGPLSTMGFFDRIKQSLTRTTQQFVERFDEIVRRADAPERRSRPIDVETLEALEELLISADVGVAATDADRRGGASGQQRAAGRCATSSRQEIRAILAAPTRRPANGHRPHVVLIVGVNGTGKTTTVGKLAQLIKDAGKSPLICAADTFRAAAVEQLEIWATRAGVDMVRARDGADPAAVVFDAIAAARRAAATSILVDTAGRLHTRVNLMNELDKIRRDRRARSRGRAARSAARARRDRRPERPGAGARVHGGRRRQRHRADEARWHRQGRHRGRDRPRPQAADPLRRRRRRHRRSDPVLVRTSTWTRCSRRSGER